MQVYQPKIITQYDFQKMLDIQNRDTRLAARRELKKIQKREKLIFNILTLSGFIGFYAIVTTLNILIDKI